MCNIGPGQTSTVLVIETDATNFKSGFVGITDGSATTIAGFEPTAPTSTTPSLSREFC